ncbi:unnamed protein product [Arctogadus glacialis]
MSEHVLTLAAARCASSTGATRGFRVYSRMPLKLSQEARRFKPTTLTSSGDTPVPFVPDAGQSGDNTSEGFCRPSIRSENLSQGQASGMILEETNTYLTRGQSPAWGHMGYSRPEGGGAPPYWPFNTSTSAIWSQI